MPEYLSPDVYVEEVSGGIKPIEGVGTSTGGFIGIAEKGPVCGAVYEDDTTGQPVFISNFTEYQRKFGGFIDGEFLAYAVRQFFDEGGTRCYVARTAHFTNPGDPASLTATRASRPLGRILTSISGGVPAAATSATVASATGLRSGMELYLNNGVRAARVRITGMPGGNTVQFQNTEVDDLGTPEPVPALTGTVSVTQVVLDVRAVDEGAWGNQLRVAVRPSGRISTTLSAPGLQPADSEATLASIAALEAGMTLFISDGGAAARVRITGIDEATNTVQFTRLEPRGASAASVAGGAAVTAVIAGKATTILDGAVNSGATDAMLASVEGIERGSVLLLVDERVGSALSPVTPPTSASERVVVSRVVGKQVFFETALGAGYPSGTMVTTEDFTLAVYDRTDLVETYANVSIIDTNVSGYAANRINRGANKSQYIRVVEPAVSGDLPPLRTAAPVRLGELPGTEGSGGGSDGAGDYIGDEAAHTGFYAFDVVDDVNIVAAPGITLRPVILAGMTYCENRGDCFYVGDVPREILTAPEVLDFKKGTGSFAGQQALASTYGSLYWPWVQVFDPITLGPILMAPAGAVAGSYSATDVRRGVHKAPAGIEDGFLNTALGIQKIVTRQEQDILNPQGINVIRSSPEFGIAIWGARTTSSDPEWRYINVRRLFLFLRESIQKGTYWAVFEPNDATLWKRLVKNISAFLRVQWLEGKLVGSKPEEAFFVKCDAETNPPESVDLGRVITIIGVAPSKPAEFVIFRIMQSRPGAS